MTFAVRNLSVLAYAQGFTLWHYKAPASRIEDVSAPDYFEPASEMLATGDMLMVSAADGGRVLFAASLQGRLCTSALG